VSVMHFSVSIPGYATVPHESEATTGSHRHDIYHHLPWYSSSRAYCPLARCQTGVKVCPPGHWVGGNADPAKVQLGNFGRHLADGDMSR